MEQGRSCEGQGRICVQLSRATPDTRHVTEHDPWDPANPRNRDRTRQSQRQVRALLIQWDPIGVADVPEAADEYDCMISPVMHKLCDGVTPDDLARWISKERTEHFGLGPDPSGDKELAAKLTSWWTERTAQEH
jgi:hypothetical protein